MIALVILVLAGAFASGYISRGLVDRFTGAGSFATAFPLPAASRRAIRRDRRRARLGLADALEVWRSPVHVATVQDRRDARLTGAISKLGSEVEPRRGWQAGVWARVNGAWRRG